MSPSRSDPASIDGYLDRLLAELRGAPGDVRRILVETEAHLRDAAAEEVAGGATPEEAERRAVERFGPPRTVARRFARVPGVAASFDVLVQLALALALVAGIGLVAVGASGAVAGAMGSVAGKRFVAGDPAGVTYTPERCADFQEYHPRPTCAQAAVAHHYDEVVEYRLGAGVLGVGVLAGWYVARRWRRVSAARGVLPEGFVGTAGSVLFGAAAVALLGQGAGMVLGGRRDGAGAYVSGGLVALLVAVGFGLSLLGVLGRRAATLVAPGGPPPPAAAGEERRLGPA